MLVHMIPMHMVQMPIVKVISMDLMFDRDMSAAGAMLMRVILMLVAIIHMRLFRFTFESPAPPNVGRNQTCANDFARGTINKAIARNWAVAGREISPTRETFQSLVV